jgi:hypothetical protein
MNNNESIIKIKLYNHEESHRKENPTYYLINDRRCGGNRHILFLMEEGATGNNRL